MKDLFIEELKIRIECESKILVFYVKNKQYLKELKQKVEIEDAKSFFDSYLLFPRSWYLSEIKKTETKLERIVKIYNNKKYE